MGDASQSAVTSAAMALDAAAAPRASSMTAPSRIGRMLAKNIAALAAIAGIWTALEAGYIAPDRPTRAQWVEIEKAKSKPAGQLVLQTDFRTARIGTGAASPWGYYNGATADTVGSDETGVTVDYQGVAWIGARLDLGALEPGAVYRLSVEAVTTGQPGAVLVRNRQRDLVRERILVGRRTAITHFAVPPGRFDTLLVAFIPDAPSNPRGSMKILNVKMERMGG
jgi:hypothetical protein